MNNHCAILRVSGQSYGYYMYNAYMAANESRREKTWDRYTRTVVCTYIFAQSYQRPRFSLSAQYDICQMSKF